MNIKKIKLVASREFNIRVKKKSFIWTTILTPLLFAALCIIPAGLMLLGEKNQEARTILVSDQSGIVAQTLKDTDKLTYEISTSHNIDSLKQNFDSLGIHAILAISALDKDNNVTISSYSKKQLNSDLKSKITSEVEDAIEDYKLGTYDISNLKEIMNDVKTNLSMETYTLGEKGHANKSFVEVNMALSYIMAFLIYMFVFAFGNMVMTSVIQEKNNRIVEVIISSVKPFDLMFGKIFGVACVAVTQFLIWIVLTVAIIFGAQAIAGSQYLKNNNPQELVQNIPGGESLKNMDSLGNITAQTGMSTQTGFEQLVSSNEDLKTIMATVSNINFPYIIINFLLYFVFGYLLYASMFAAVGSAVEEEADTQQLTIPITIPLMLGLFIMLYAFQHPDSGIAVWGSIIPFTSPMVMLARIPFVGGVPFWQLALSLGLLVITAFLFMLIAGKIYRVGILMYGKKASWKDMGKWLKY